MCDGSTGASGEYNRPVTEFQPTQLIGDPAAANLDNGAPGCGDLVFATSTSVYLLAPCVARPDGEIWDTSQPVRTTVFESSAPVTITGLYAGPIGNVNEDDILIQTTAGLFFYDKTSRGVGKQERFIAADPSITVVAARDRATSTATRTSTSSIRRGSFSRRARRSRATRALVPAEETTTSATAGSTSCRATT